MSFEAITVEKADGIATITMNRPEALNAITRTMLKELKSAVDAAASDDEVGLIVLTGAGRAFSAGVDLKELGVPEGPKMGEILEKLRAAKLDGDAVNAADERRLVTTLLAENPL